MAGLRMLNVVRSVKKDVKDVKDGMWGDGN